MTTALKNKVEELAEKFEGKTSFASLTNVKEEIIKETDVRETALEEGMRQLYIKENLEMKTELSAPLILAMSRGMTFVDRFKSNVMKKFIENIQVLSVSKGRKGRQELVALVRNSQEADFGYEQNMGSFAKLIGKS